MVKDYIYFNDRIIAPGDAGLPLNDLVILRGYGIFDYLRSFRYQPLFIEDYVARFFRSASSMRLPVPLDQDELIKTIRKLLDMNKLEEAGIRMLLTGGASPDAFSLVRPNFIILIEDINFPAPTFYQNGIKLVTHEYLREWSEVKTINYLTAIKLLPDIKKEGAFDVLYKFQGNLLEVSRSNFFIIRNGCLITPDQQILFGITRKKVLEIAERICPVEMRTVKYEELYQADEAFMTGTTKKVLPVTRVDDITIGNGQVGSLTSKLKEAFKELEEKANH